jgi:hypothetical protein
MEFQQQSCSLLGLSKPTMVAITEKVEIGVPQSALPVGMLLEHHDKQRLHCNTVLSAVAHGLEPSPDSVRVDAASRHQWQGIQEQPFAS